MLLRDEVILEYHEHPRPGKLEVVTSKPCRTQRDLSMAYTPGVDSPALARSLKSCACKFAGCAVEMTALTRSMAARE